MLVKLLHFLLLKILLSCSHINLARNILLGVCFPLGKGMYRVLHIPEDEAVLLNSREKAPYLICVEVLKGEMPPRYNLYNFHAWCKVAILVM